MTENIVYNNELLLKKNIIYESFKNCKIFPIIKSKIYFNYRNDITYNNNKIYNNKIGSNISLIILNYLLKYNIWKSVKIREDNNNNIMLIFNNINNKSFINNIIIEELSLIVNENNYYLYSIYECDINIFGNKYIITNLYNFNIYISPKTFRQINYSIYYQSYNLIKKISKKINKRNVILIAGDITALLITINDIFHNKLCLTNDINIYNDLLYTLKKNHQLKCNHLLINYDKYNFDNTKYNKLLILNPGRSGMKNNIINNINIHNNITNIIYISCNIKSALLNINNLSMFKITKIYPFDQLPQTNYIELIILMKRIYIFI